MNLPHNRIALASLLTAGLTLISFCLGIAPIPMTALACYPLAAFTGVVSLVTGIIALRQIRQTGQPGRWMALAGMGLGGITLLAIICATTITAILLYFGADYLQTINPDLFPKN